MIIFFSKINYGYAIKINIFKHFNYMNMKQLGVIPNM